MQDRIITPVDGDMIVFLLDADGCLYSYYYQHILHWIIDNFGNFYVEMAERYASNNLSASDRSALACKRDEIIGIISNEITKLNDEDVVCDGYPCDDFYFDAIDAIRELDHELLSKVFILSNSNFIAHLIEESKHYNHVRIMIGSARQTLNDDYSNAENNRTGLFFHDMPTLLNHLKKVMPDKSIDFNQATLPDVFNASDLGHHYKQALKPFSSAVPYYFGDKLKECIVYLATHTNRATGIVDIRFYDDVLEITKHCHQAYSEYPELIPTNCLLTIVNYDGITKAPHEIIQGKGPEDNDLHNSFRALSSFHAEKSHHAKFFSRTNRPTLLSLSLKRGFEVSSELAAVLCGQDSDDSKDPGYPCPFTSCAIS